jgi:peptidoglycan/xylan/chitin deacetylase (PgdA/CDA1 family)
MPARQLAKTAVEQGLLRSGLPGIFSRLRRSDALILAYHNVVPDGERVVGDSSLHLPRSSFAAQLDALLEMAEVVPLDVALAGGARSSGRPRVAITFDDAYRGAVLVGVGELTSRGLPATIFVPPALLDGGVFWWDALTPRGKPGLADAVREDALQRLAGKGSAILAEHQCHDTSHIPAYARGASEAELHSAVESSGITLASHSWSHPNLAALSATELEEELVRPLDWLRARFDRTLPYISYPYGHHSPAVERAAAAAGYRAGLRIEGGWLRDGAANRYAIPRLNIPAGISEAGFRLRCSGLLG